MKFITPEDRISLAILENEKHFNWKCFFGFHKYIYTDDVTIQQGGTLGDWHENYDYICMRCLKMSCHYEPDANRYYEYMEDSK